MQTEQRLDTAPWGEILLSLEENRDATERLIQAVAQAFQPLVITDPPDLTEIVTAIQGLKGPATTEEIADALAKKLTLPEIPKDESVPLLVDTIKELKESLDFRLRGLGRSFGGGGVNIGSSVMVRDRTNSANNLAVDDQGRLTFANSFATQATQENIMRGLTDYEARLDYDASNNLIYSGKAPNATATSASTWTIQKLSYTGSNLTRVQVLTGSWNDRAVLPW